MGAQHMERFVRVPCGLHPGAPHGGPQLDWRQHVGAPTFLARPRLLVPANASDYCGDPYKRAQLQAVLAHMNRSLSLRLCKGPCKEVGVQVSLRADKSVQCSLGPRTLRSRSPAWGGGSPGMGRRAWSRLREDEDHADSKVSTSRSPAHRRATPAPEGAASPPRKATFQVNRVPRFSPLLASACPSFATMSRALRANPALASSSVKRREVRDT